MNEHIADKHRILREYEAQAQVLRQKLAAAERARKNHAETLIGIASMDPSDGKRMRMWAKDGLSGYKEPVESTVLKLSDERNAAVQRAEAAERERDEARAELAENGTKLCCAYCGWIVTGITDPEQRRAAVVEHFLDCPKAPYAQMAFALQMGAICDEHIGVHQPACPICAARDRTRELTESLIQAANWQKRAEAAERRVEELTAELLNLRHTLDAALWRADRCERENLTLRVAVYQAHTATSEISRAIEAAGCSPALTAAINAVTRQRDALAAALALHREGDDRG